jgi:hypothetical protein
VRTAEQKFATEVTTSGPSKRAEKTNYLHHAVATSLGRIKSMQSAKNKVIPPSVSKVSLCSSISEDGSEGTRTDQELQEGIL